MTAIFVRRENNVPTDEQLVRQLKARDIVFGLRRPRTPFELKVAAVVGHPRVNPIVRAKARKMLGRATIDPSDVSSFVAQLKAEKPRLEIGDFVQFDRKCRSLDAARSIPRSDDEDRDALKLAWAPLEKTSLQEFERLCFDGQTSTKYYENTSFAYYLYQNLMDYVGASEFEDPEQALLNNDAWQAKLALALLRSRRGCDDEAEISETLAVRAFYDDSVAWNGAIYDTSYVPKYDVEKLRPLPRETARRRGARSIARQIDYYNSFDPSVVSVTPEQFRDVFAVFPFKSGYHVNSTNGRASKLSVRPIELSESTKTRLFASCDEHSLDRAADNLTLDYQTLLARAVYSSNVHEIATYMMLLDRFVRASGCADARTKIYVDEIEVPLPTRDQILHWYEFPCDRARAETLALPLNGANSASDEQTAARVERFVDVISNIVATSGSKFGAIVRSANYRLVESDMEAVYRRLRTPSERYVFLTMVLQDHDIEAVRKARDQLATDAKLRFGNEPSVPRPYERKIDSPYEVVAPSTDAERIVDGSCDRNMLWRSFEMYRFANDQLHELVENGDSTLTADQNCSLVALSYRETGCRDSPGQYMST